MARRIRWQIVIAVISGLLVTALLSGLALSTTTVSRPLAGGTYVEAIVGRPTHINPLLNDPLADPPGRDIIVLMFDGLTRIGTDGLPRAALAEGWTIDQSGTTYTFSLRRDAFWHDGEPFDAGDVIFTIQTVQRSDFPGDPTLANLWRNVEMERIDDHTIVFSLTAPYARFLSETRIPILPEHMLTGVPIEQWPQTRFARHPIGTGPYQLVELTHEHALLEANPHYFGKVPFIEQMELRFIDSPHMALSALINEEVEALGSRATPELSKVDIPGTYRKIRLPLDEYAVLTFNMRQEPLDNGDMRRALAYGLDKNMLIEQALDGLAVPIDTPILPGWWTYTPNSDLYTVDPALAAQILDTLGYSPNAQGQRSRDGEPLMLSLITDKDPLHRAVAEGIARQWEAIGIGVEIEQLESIELRRKLIEHDFTLALHEWARVGNDPDVFELWHSSQAPSGLNYAGLRNEDIDKMLINGRTEQELAARSESYADFQQHWSELVPSIVLYQPLYTFMVSEQLDGLSCEESGTTNSQLLVGLEDRYRSVTEWFVNSSQEIQGTLR